MGIGYVFFSLPFAEFFEKGFIVIL